MILADTVYGGTFEFVHNILPRFGVEFTSVSGINKLSLPHQHSKLTGATTLICAVALLIFGSRLLHTHDQAETADLY
jgi:cystathionine beta-lyase/cystathionine gamma-synthase